MTARKLTESSKGETTKARKLIALFIVVAIVWTALALEYGPLNLRGGDFTLFGKVIGTLILMSAIMERVLDVFLTFLYSESADETSDKLEACEKEVEAAKKALEAAPGDTDAKVGLTKAGDALSEAKDKRRDQRTKTRQAALPAAIVLGVLISAIGFRVLDSLVDVGTAAAEAPWWVQPNVFQVIDVVLTGAVLAGGSDGLHKLMEVYRRVTEKRS